MFEHDANYAGTHEALALVADHRGDAQTARAERALVEKYWKNADPDLPELKTPSSPLPHSSTLSPVSEYRTAVLFISARIVPSVSETSV